MERTRTQAWLVADDLGYESEGDEVTTSSDVVVASSSSRLPRKHSEASHRATATTKERGHNMARRPETTHERDRRKEAIVRKNKKQSLSSDRMQGRDSKHNSSTDLQALQHKQPIWQELDTTLEVLGMQAKLAPSNPPRNPTSRAGGAANETAHKRWSSPRWGVLAQTAQATSRRRASSPHLTNHHANATQSHLLSSHRPHSSHSAAAPAQPSIAEHGGEAAAATDGRPPLSPAAAEKATLAAARGFHAAAVQPPRLAGDTAVGASVGDTRDDAATPPRDEHAAGRQPPGEGADSAGSSSKVSLRPDAPSWQGAHKAVSLEASEADVRSEAVMRVVNEHNHARRRNSESNIPSTDTEEAAASSSSYADGNNAAQAGGPLEHAASLGSPGRAPSLHDIFYEERAQWRQDLSKFMDGGKVLKRALKRLNSILETARKHEQTIVPNLSMNTTDEIMEYTQKQLRRFGVMQSSVHEVWGDLLEHSNLLRTANMWVPHFGAFGDGNESVASPLSSPMHLPDGASVLDTPRLQRRHSLEDATSMDRCKDAATAMEAAAHALQRMYRGCVGAAQCLMDVVGTEIEPAAPSGGDPAAAAGTAGGTEPGGRDASGNVPEGGIVPQPRVLCMRYVVTGMVDEGLHMDRLLRECIDAFRGGNVVQEHGLPHSDSRGLFRTGSKELQAVLTPTNSGEESPRLPTSRHNSAHFSTERVARELASDDLPDLYVGSFLEMMEELSDTVGAISLMVITMARRVARRDVEHWKATVRYTGLAGYMGLFHSPAPLTVTESSELLAVMKTSMGEPLLHWSANLVRNTSYRIVHAWPYQSPNVVPALSKLVTEAVIGLQDIVALCTAPARAGNDDVAPAFVLERTLTTGHWTLPAALSTVGGLLEAVEVLLDLGLLAIDSTPPHQAQLLGEVYIAVGEAHFRMALAVVTCISSWRGHMKQSSKDELEALQEVARKGIVYVRNWDQSDISRAIFNPEDFSTLKERTDRAVNVMMKAQRLTSEVADREAERQAAQAAARVPTADTEPAERNNNNNSPQEMEPKGDLAAADLAAAFAAAAATCSGDLPPGLGADFLNGVGNTFTLGNMPRRVAGLSSLAPLARPKKGGSSSGLGSALGLGSVREQLQADKFWDCEWPKPIKVIGSGSFGVTYVAKWHMAHVAMKVMKFDEANEEQGFASFFFEVDFHRMLHHPNVVRFLGASTRGPTRSPALLLELCDKSLLEIINQARKTGGATLDWGRRLHYALDCARGMCYLHARGVMHNDLKSANLLVDRAGCLKVCDFGMSRLHGRQNPEQELHSPAWMAPEVLRGDAYNASADVYSFGVVLWELATLQIPWDGVNRHAIRYWVVEKETHLPLVAEGDAIEGNEPPSEQYVGLVSRCWSQSSAGRPSFEEIAVELERMYKKLKREQRKP